MKLKATLTVLLTAILLSESAAALSCMRPDLAQTMERVKTSEKNYYVLVGQFNFAPPMPHPPMDYTNQHVPKPPIVTKASFEGFSLGRNRYEDQRLSRFPVDIKVTCSGPWCGKAPPSGTRMIAFVEAPYGASPVLNISACPGNTFTVSRGDGQVRKLRTCLDNKCVSDQPTNWR